MKMKQNIVVLYVGRYSGVEDGTGRVFDGTSVSYLYGDTLESQMNSNDTLGQRPAKANFKADDFSKFPAAPAIYEGEFVMSIDSKGKPALKLEDVKFLSLVELNPRAVQDVAAATSGDKAKTEGKGA